MARLFVAVWPPAHVVAQMCALPRLDEPGVRWVPSEYWHVTLRFLGDTEPPDAVDRLTITPLPAARAVLGPVVRRLGQRALVVPVAGLDQLAAVVGAATADLGEPPGSRLFDGHLTLARLRRGATSDLVGTPIAAEIVVTEIVLVHSVVTHVGATYQVIAQWPTVTR